MLILVTTKIQHFIILKTVIPVFSRMISWSGTIQWHPRTPDMLFWFPKVTLWWMIPYNDIIMAENMPRIGLRNLNVTHGHLDNLASPGDLEESASHHVLITFTTLKHNIVRQHSEISSEASSWCTETSSRDQISWFREIALDYSRYIRDGS